MRLNDLPPTVSDSIQDSLARLACESHEMKSRVFYSEIKNKKAASESGPQ